MIITAATPEQFDEFLTEYGYTVPDGDKSRLLALSLSFLGTLDMCAEGETHVAQCFIAYAMRDGGGFDPVAVADDKTLIAKGLGRNAIAKEWQVNDSLTGTEPLTLLKRVPMAYGLLRPLLCSTGGIGNIELMR